jgi:hypothetical protein
MPDFRTAAAEFDRQAEILEALLATIDVCARSASGIPTLIVGVPIPRIPRGGQNTMAAAAVKLIDAYWRCGSNKLARIRPRHDSDWIVGASGTLKSLIDYPVNGVATQFVARMISEHENNMRWDTITELF